MYKINTNSYQPEFISNDLQSDAIMLRYLFTKIAINLVNANMYRYLIKYQGLLCRAEFLPTGNCILTVNPRNIILAN